MKCQTCNLQIQPNCDWNQGRCPHREPLLSSAFLDNYHFRYYNLIQSIKRLFAKKEK